VFRDGTSFAPFRTAVKVMVSALATTDSARTQSKVITAAEKTLVRVINTILSGKSIVVCKYGSLVKNQIV
jgi:hypothetical protein